jgi:hypothetical protein
VTNLAVPALAHADGQSVLDYFGLDGVDKGRYIGYDSLFFLAFGVLAYLVLSYVKHQKR